MRYFYVRSFVFVLLNGWLQENAVDIRPPSHKYYSNKHNGHISVDLAINKLLHIGPSRG